MTQQTLERIEILKTKVADFPQSPGVYIMKNIQDKVIYVGKAIRLRNRVRSYFNLNQDHLLLKNTGLVIISGLKTINLFPISS